VEKWKKVKVKNGRAQMYRYGKQSGESMASVLKKKKWEGFAEY